jgi:hypothetical protein
MTGHNISSVELEHFSDLDKVLIAEARINDPISTQIEMIAIQVEAWSREWRRRTHFLTKKVIPLGVKISLMDMTIRGGLRFCRYEIVVKS